MAISGSTRLVGIIGDPVTHSLSPAIHNAAFAAAGLDIAYVPLPVASPSVEAAVRGLVALGFRGANVTMPHKAAVMAYLDEVADDARLIAAVNTVVVDEGIARGYNTDIDGFVRALREVVPGSLTHTPALVLGAGGAARAAALGLAREGVPAVTVANRTVATANDLVARLRPAFPSVTWSVAALAEVGANHVSEARLLVNCTPLGMVEEHKVSAVFVDNLRRDHIVYDVVYGKRPTKLLTDAKASGARTVEGLSMLVWQAAFAFELWTGITAPLDVMRSAARQGRQEQ